MPPTNEEKERLLAETHQMLGALNALETVQDYIKSIANQAKNESEDAKSAVCGAMAIGCLCIAPMLNDAFKELERLMAELDSLGIKLPEGNSLKGEQNACH